MPKKTQLPIVTLPMAATGNVAPSYNPPDQVGESEIVKTLSGTHKRVSLAAEVRAEVLTVHFQKGTMRIRIIAEPERHSFAGTRDVSAEPFLAQYQVLSAVSGSTACTAPKEA